MEDKLTQEVAKIVEQIFASKKEDEMRQRTEDALNQSASTIETLTSELESANDKISDLESKISASATEKAEVEKAKVEELAAVKAELDAKVAELETATKQLEEKASELDNIKKDALAATRMATLESAGIARKDKEAQTARVREMSDEDFEAYKAELESVRAHILAELDKDKADKEAAEKEEAAKAEAAAKAAAEGGEGVNTPPANVDKDKVVHAALNMEVYPSEDLKKLYEDMGKAMAKAITKED